MFFIADSLSFRAVCLHGSWDHQARRTFRVRLTLVKVYPRDVIMIRTTEIQALAIDL